MKKIRTEIIIDTHVSTVWKVLTDFENFPDWNPFVTSVQGVKSVGASLKVACKQPNSKMLKFKPTILNFDPNKEFRWKGKLGIKGIFDGQHYFKLEKLNENQTRFIHGEDMSGILVSLLGSKLDKMNISFESMNVASKKECEKIK